MRQKKPMFKKRDFISNYDWLSLQHSSVSSISGMDETVRKKKQIVIIVIIIIIIIIIIK